MRRRSSHKWRISPTNSSPATIYGRGGLSCQGNSCGNVLGSSPPCLVAVVLLLRAIGHLSRSAFGCLDTSMKFFLAVAWRFTAEQTLAAILPGVAGAAVALFAALITLWFARRNWTREVINQRLNVLATELKYFEDFRKWANQLADALTEAIHLCDLESDRVTGESFFDRRHRLRIFVSAMIDRGRWFFPNIEVDDHGADKEVGYRGYRHGILDELVAAYKLLGQLDSAKKFNNRSVRDQLTICKRDFVGQVQLVLDPNNRLDYFDQIRRQAVQTLSPKA
jgi:hypothetical protein